MADQKKLDNFSTAFLKSDGDIQDKSIQDWMLATPPGGTAKTVVITVTSPAEVINIGTGLFYFTCPAELNGMNLVSVGASVITASSSGDPTIMLSRGRRSSVNGACTYVDMLTTAITIDATKYDSANATTPAVISTANDDIVSATYVDLIRINVTTAGTGATGLEVRMSFQSP